MSGYNEYLENNVQTLNPLGRVIAVYDHTLTCLHRARRAIELNNVPARGEQIGKALRCIGELSACLDPVPAPELAEQLAGLYQTVSMALIDANRDEDDKAIESVEKILSTLREGWKEIRDRGLDGGSK